MKKILIGGGQGFWGDSNDAAIHMIRRGNLNYMACDYLAELTLSIMERQRMKDSNKGFADDFIKLMDEIAKESYEKKNPHSDECRRDEYRRLRGGAQKFGPGKGAARV